MPELAVRASRASHKSNPTNTSSASNSALQTIAINSLRALQKDHIDPLMTRVLDEKRAELPLNSTDSLELLAHIKEFLLRPGKRFRPALLYMTYKGFGGGQTPEEIEHALLAGIATEFIHSFLLIHDDIIDQDALRRGKPSMHEIYRSSYGQRVKVVPQDAQTLHIGESMAIIAGDILQTYAMDIISRLNLDADRIVKLVREMNAMTQNAGYGEMIEVWKGLTAKMELQDILQVYDLKTAQYTMQGPMMMAAVLAQKDGQYDEQLKKLAYNVGIMYQIRDDVIGMFGTEEEIGKPVGSDIEEGRQTLLVYHARAHANKMQALILNNALGNQHLTPETIDDVRAIIRETGAQEYCMDEMLRMKKQASEILDELPFTEETDQFFRGILEYMVLRNT